MTDADSNEEEIVEEVVIPYYTQQALWIQGLVNTEGNFESPIDINLTNTVPYDLAPLEWYHLDLICKKMKISNTGHTILLSATWHNVRPFVRGGPFVDKYIFSQLHFHWGRTNMEGSEHTVDGAQLPFEMHVVYYNDRYLTHEKAIRQKDGVAVFAYFFKTLPNPAVDVLIDYFELIQKANSAVRMDSLPLIFLVRKFEEDYFLYWGSINTSGSNHIALWLICREPIGISVDQVESFRYFFDVDEVPLLQNFRTMQPLGKRRLFHICPGSSKYATLLPISEEQNMFQMLYKYSKPKPEPDEL